MDPITDIEVQLSEKDGNAFAIIGTVRSALRKGGRADLIDQFTKEAAAEDYDHLLRTCMKYVVVS